MKISVIGNFEKDNITLLLLNIIDIILGKCKISVSKAYKNSLNISSLSYVNDEELYKNADIIIAIGGDGTIMRVAKKAAFYNNSVLGINAGRLGFLSSIEKDELNMLKNILKGNYKIEKRILLKAEVTEKNKSNATYEFHCLNDAVFSRGDFARLINVNIKSDNRQLLNVRADGVIISTPTGSTAYSLSAGGPVLSPDLNCFVATSICPHSLVDRSIVVNSDKPLFVSTYSDVKNNSILTCDGEKPIILNNDSIVKISLSPYTAKIIKIKPDNFYEIVKKKIIERGI